MGDSGVVECWSMGVLGKNKSWTTNGHELEWKEKNEKKNEPRKGEQHVVKTMMMMMMMK